MTPIKMVRNNLKFLDKGVFYAEDASNGLSYSKLVEVINQKQPRIKSE